MTDTARVGCTLGFDVTEPAEIVLRIAAAVPRSESLVVSSDGRAVDVAELAERQHVVHAPAGHLTVTYSAEIEAVLSATDRPHPRWVGPQSHPGTTETTSHPQDVTPEDRITAMRPSRYCPSDRLAGFAAKEFGSVTDPTAAVRAITAWVHDHLSYEPGSSGPTTDAVDTLLSGAGVCRDYAHLVATLCRARDIPARTTAVYAPGLSPMDFHLVVEAALDGVWTVWDATRLAPRQTLIRIASGRDAADTALATTLSGMLTMPEMVITAVAAHDLPFDDHSGLVTLA